MLVRVVVEEGDNEEILHDLELPVVPQIGDILHVDYKEDQAFFEVKSRIFSVNPKLIENMGSESAFAFRAKLIVRLVDYSL